MKGLIFLAQIYVMGVWRKRRASLEDIMSDPLCKVVENRIVKIGDKITGGCIRYLDEYGDYVEAPVKRGYERVLIKGFKLKQGLREPYIFKAEYGFLIKKRVTRDYAVWDVYSSEGKLLLKNCVYLKLMGDKIHCKSNKGTRTIDVKANA